jgi:glycosyltransferase involved in cell wall biosynthesis
LRKLKPVVFMLGHPWHRKGVDIVSKAIAELNKHTTKTVTLAITMAGGESEIRHGIEKVLGSVPTWIIFLKPREDLATYYNNSDVFISAGRDEGLTYAAIEAAYCSTMVACSNISGNPLDVPNLFVYETEDHLALKAGIETLLALTNQQRNVAKLVQQEYILKHYDLGSWVKRTMRVYIEILRQVG